MSNPHDSSPPRGYDDLSSKPRSYPRDDPYHQNPSRDHSYHQSNHRSRDYRSDRSSVKQYDSYYTHRSSDEDFDNIRLDRPRSPRDRPDDHSRHSFSRGDYISDNSRRQDDQYNREKRGYSRDYHHHDMRNRSRYDDRERERDRIYHEKGRYDRRHDKYERDSRDHHKYSKGDENSAKKVKKNDKSDELMSILKKLTKSDPHRVDHATLISSSHPTYARISRLASLQFLKPDEKTVISDKIKANVRDNFIKKLKNTQNSSLLIKLDPEQETQLKMVQLEAVQKSLKHRPNFFVSGLLSTVGGGSIFKGQNAKTYSGIPGVGATTQLPINYTTERIVVQSVDLQRLQDLQKDQNAIAVAGTSTVTNFANLTEQQKLLVTKQSNFQPQVYKEPIDKISPIAVRLPSNIPKISYWTLFINDRSSGVFQFITAYTMFPAELSAENDMKQVKGEPNQSDINKIITDCSPSQPITLQLKQKSCFSIGSNEYTNDIVLSKIPNMSKPSPISTHPILIQSPQKIDLIQKKIDQVWDKIITENSTILDIHCYIQFRAIVKDVVRDDGQLVKAHMAVPYLYNPNVSPPGSHANDDELLASMGTCWFKEKAANTPTGFTKSAIPTGKFVEILHGDVVLLGSSNYELVFLKQDYDNPLANDNRAMLRGD